ncbi:hypothetical protein [Streptomyces sp. NPDC059008]|uniref:hypothetical protein n=1 Tax=Streptomyces sp. NPDC059008 TaxID=3346693 RepID=UPI0036BA9576
MSDEAINETEPAAPDAVVYAPPAAEDLSAELEQLRAQLAEYVPIVQAHQEAEEARKTEEQHLREQVEAVQSELGEARRLLLREVADETGLSADVIALIQGSTKDELLSAASVIAERAKSTSAAPKRPTPTVDGGTDAPSTDSDDIGPIKIARAFAKRARF